MLRDKTLGKLTLCGLIALALTLLTAAPVTAQTTDAEDVTPVFQIQRPIPVVMVDEDGDALPVASRVTVQTGNGRGWYLGLRGGAYFDVDEPFIGAELLFPLGGRVYFNPNIEWVFVDNADLLSANADLHYDLDTDGDYMFWLGAGLGMRYFKLDRPNADGDWDPGLNLLAGMGFGGGDFIPYIQAKYYIADDNSEFILAGGFRF